MNTSSLEPNAILFAPLKSGLLNLCSNMLNKLEGGDGPAPKEIWINDFCEVFSLTNRSETLALDQS